MRILADAEATSPSPGSHGGTARCRRSLTTTYYRRRTEESLGAFCRDQDLHLADLRRQAEEHHHNHKTSPGADRAIEFEAVCIHVRTNSVSLSCMSLSVAVVVSVYVSLSVEV